MIDPELEVLIDNYLDGRMDGYERTRFERRMETDPELRERVNSATRSVELVQQALNWATPTDEFDTKVNIRVQEISQSKINPAEPGVERNLTKDDPEARLLQDPSSDRDNRRMIWIALATALAFAGAICAIIFIISRKG